MSAECTLVPDIPESCDVALCAYVQVTLVPEALDQGHVSYKGQLDVGKNCCGRQLVGSGLVWSNNYTDEAWRPQPIYAVVRSELSNSVVALVCFEGFKHFVEH
jgi:hypothetical protein